MRPAAFKRGTAEKLKFVDVVLSVAPACANSAAMQGRGFSLMRHKPSATSARFAPIIGIRSATVPSVAKSVYSRHK